MTTYTAKIRKQAFNDNYYLIITGKDKDGDEWVVNDFTPRSFKTQCSAEKAAKKYFKNTF